MLRGLLCVAFGMLSWTQKAMDEVLMLALTAGQLLSLLVLMLDALLVMHQVSLRRVQQPHIVFSCFALIWV